MLSEKFIKTYESALATQDWAMVEPLIADKASVTFSNGTVHVGKAKIQAAFEHNFSMIKSEKYSIDNIVWLTKKAEYAVYLFEYNWAGIINNTSVSGSGIGTSVIIKEAGKWKLLTEHLGRKPDKL